MVAEIVDPLDGGTKEPARPRAQGKPTTKSRVPVLDGVRGIAALGVLTVHTAYAGGVMDVGEKEGWPILGWLTVGGTVILAPFFLLSGMLLYRSFARSVFNPALKTQPLKQFFARRLTRIMPGYWVVVVATLLLINFTAIDDPWYVLRPLLLLHYFVDQTQAWVPGLEITWSVVTEFFFYLILPVWALGIKKFASKGVTAEQKLNRIIGSLVPFIALGIGWVVFTHLPFMGAYPIENMWPPGFLGLLGIGMMFGAMSAYHDVTGKEPAFYAWVARKPMAWWGAAFVLYIINCIKPFTKSGSGDYPPMSQAVMDHVLFLGFAVLLMAPLIAPSARSNFMDAVLGNKVAQFMGRISFGIYLWHFPVLYFVFGMGSVFGTPPLPMFMVVGTINFWWLITQVLAGSILLATLTFYLVERPAGKLGGRMFRSGAPTATL